MSLHLLGSLVYQLASPSALPSALERGRAYLDPGSGSFILQLLLAALLGAAFLVKVYWGKIKAFFGGVFSKKEQEQSDE